MWLIVQKQNYILKIKFPFTYDIEKQQILTFEKLKPKNIFPFLFEKLHLVSDQ